VSKVYSGFGVNLGLPEGNATAWLVPDIDAYAKPTASTATPASTP
jgi:iron complex outermembrane receptor protein